LSLLHDSNPVSIMIKALLNTTSKKVGLYLDMNSP